MYSTIRCITHYKSFHDTYGIQTYAAFDFLFHTDCLYAITWEEGATTKYFFTY